MSLPVPNLDDRRFQDLVDEAKRMIPSLTPEWTNHNVADPGVALIELFAWMSEQVIYRLNQVPERLYIDLLNLLDVQPFPATPAQVPLVFWLAGVPDQTVVVPAGTEVATRDRDGVVFATVDTLRITQPRIEGAVTSAGETVYVDVLEALRYDRDVVTCFTSQPVRPGDAFHLGFPDPLAGHLLELRIETAERGVGVDPERVPIVWEAWSGEHWLPAQVVADTTGGLNRSGAVRLAMPPRHESLVLAGQRQHWLRVRLVEPEPGQPTFTASPKLTEVRAVTLGGTVLAEHARRAARETLGSSDGTPGQRFELANRPVLPRRDGEQVTVIHEGTSEVYNEVADFSASGPADRHVRIDEAAGVVEFGPRIRYPDGQTVQHGAVPPFGARVTISGYRTGGGAAGNVGAGTLTGLRTSVPYVDRVENLQPARGGVDPETVEEVKLRGPRSLRTGQRAVTPTDYEQLTLEASPQVARARCLAPATPTDPIRVLVVPTSDRDPQLYELDDFALSPELFETVRSHLDLRRTIGARVAVTAPYYQGVSVIVRVRAAAGRSPAAVRERVAVAISRFLSPLTGGTRATGWGFGTDLHAATLVSVLEEVAGVSAVDELALFEYDLRNRQRLGDARDRVELEEGSLFLASGNQVVVR
ncbi:MAG: putative baseplate assembly protein [Nitriliruptoraceae bacterium]